MRAGSSRRARVRGALLLGGALLTGFLLIGTAGDRAAADEPAASPAPAATRPVGAVADDYPDGVACLSLIAISTSLGNFCSDTCMTQQDCPASWGCFSLLQGNDEIIHLCIPKRHLPAS